MINYIIKAAKQVFNTEGLTIINNRLERAKQQNDSITFIMPPNVRVGGHVIDEDHDISGYPILIVDFNSNECILDANFLGVTKKIVPSSIIFERA